MRLEREARHDPEVATPTASATPQATVPVELSLDQIPLTPNSADAVRSLDATATVNLEEGGWAAVIFRNPDGVPVAGYVLIADDYLVSDPTSGHYANPCGNVPLVPDHPTWGGTARGTYPSGGFICDVIMANHSTEFGLTIERGPSLNVAKIGPVPEPMVIFHTRDVGSDETDAYSGETIADVSLTGGMFVEGSNGVLTAGTSQINPAVSYMP